MMRWQPSLKRSVRGSYPPCPIKALARPPRAPWEEAPVRPPKPGQHDGEESYGRVQGSVRKGCYAICGISGVLARSHDGEPPMEGGFRQEPGIAWPGGTCWWHVSGQWLPAKKHPPPRYTLHKDGTELSCLQSSTPPGTGSIPSREQSPVCR